MNWLTQRYSNAFDTESRGLDRFGVLLGVTVVTICLLALVDLTEVEQSNTQQAGALAVNVLVASSLLLALRAAGLGGRRRLVIEVLVGVGLLVQVGLFVAHLAGNATAEMGVSQGPSTFFVALSILSPVAVVTRLANHRRVTRETLLGAVSGYMLIALAAVLVFLFVDASQSTPFFGQDEPTTGFMYFSLTTISTAGLGDLAPATALGRLLTGSVAIIGQIYLVVFVAMVVGLFIQARSE